MTISTLGSPNGEEFEKRIKNKESPLEELTKLEAYELVKSNKAIYLDGANMENEILLMKDRIYLFDMIDNKYYDIRRK